MISLICYNLKVTIVYIYIFNQNQKSKKIIVRNLYQIRREDRRARSTRLNASYK